MKQDVRCKPPIKYNSDGSISLDGSGVKILRLLEPQGEPEIIECDGIRYVPERTCELEYGGIASSSIEADVWFCSECGSPIYNDMVPAYCTYCGAKVVE